MEMYIVDDDLAMQRTLNRAVVQCGYQSQAFDSGKRFLAALPTLPFGCLLLDVTMPDVTGIDVLEAIAELPVPFPTIIISGSIEVDHPIRAFRLGAVNFLRKPYRLAELKAALEEAQQLGRTRQEEFLRRKQASSVHLTAREKEVLTGMVEGQLSKIIAFNLGLSVRTVEMHRAHVMAKLHARNSSQAVSKARELQLI